MCCLGSPLRSWLGLAGGASCVVGVLLGPGPAQAYEARVEASWDAQFYAVRSPFGEPTLARRRYTSTLGLDVDDLQGSRERGGPVLSFRSRMRVDADFGLAGAELDPSSNRYVPGLSQAPLDLMYAYFEGRALLRGLLDFRLGRQYVIDALGFWSFDGARVTLTLPLYVDLAAFSGFEQRSGLPMLSNARFSADGVWRGDRDALELRQYRSFLDDSALAPAFGAWLETRDVPYLHARFGYRKVVQRSRVQLAPFADDVRGLYMDGGYRTSSERVAGSVRMDHWDLGALTVSAAYDLYAQRVGDAAATLDWFATSELVLGTDLEYYVPSFDGDSIFNWFTQGATRSVLARVSFAPVRSFDVAGSGGVRWFETEGDATTTSAASSVERDASRSADLVATLGSRYRFSGTSVALQANAQDGERGHRVGADLTTRKAYASGRYDSLLVLSLYDWADALRPSRDATSFSYVLGGGYTPGVSFASRGRLGIEWEHSVNRLVGQRFRLLLTLDMTVLQ